MTASKGWNVKERKWQREVNSAERNWRTWVIVSVKAGAKIGDSLKTPDSDPGPGYLISPIEGAPGPKFVI